MKVAGCLFLMIMGLGAGVHAHSEWSITHSASEIPDEVALKDLIARGPVGNPHVAVTDFILCSNYACQLASPSGPWGKVWVPILPADDVPANHDVLAQPTVPQAILVSTTVRGPQDLKNQTPKMRAMVTNSVEGTLATDPSVQAQLQQAYPAIHFEKCLLIEQGRVPLSRQEVYLWASAGAICFGLGLSLFLFSFFAQIRLEKVSGGSASKRLDGDAL